MKYYEGQLVDFDNIKSDEYQDLKKQSRHHKEEKKSKGLKDEKLKPKKHISPIL